MQPRFETLVAEFALTAQTKGGEGLTRMLDGVEDALLDFADRAESIRGRQGFYDANAEMARNRGRIERGFARLIQQGFDDFLHLQSEAATALTDSELALLEKEDFEDRLAVDTIAGRGARQCHAELYALKQRLAVINRGVKISDAQVPAGPYHLTRAFAESLQGLAIERRIKLLLYALFYKHVVENARELYEDLNERLIQAGVLPYLKPVVENPERAAPPRPPQAAPAPVAGTAPAAPATTRPGTTTGGRRPAGRDSSAPAPKPTDIQQRAPASRPRVSDLVLRDLLDLLGRRKAAAGQPSAGPNLTPTGAPPIPPRELADVIAGAPAAPELPTPAQTLRDPGEIAPELGPALMAQIGAALSHQREVILTLAGRERLRTIDSDTIDLVGMLFEYMLSAEELPNAVKALLSHLHTPYLKLAILDQSFLNRPDHPARGLLDLMIEAGSTQVVETDLRRGIYPDLRDTVNRVLSEFKENVEIFGDLLAGLRKRLEGQREKTQSLEKRSREAEQGRQRLRLAQAEANAQMTALMSHRSLPQVTVNFLTGFLTEKLTLVLLRGPRAKESPDWNRTLELARTLVRVSCREGLENWRRNRPKLAGLQKVISAEPKLLGSYYSRQVEELLGWLADIEKGATARAVEQLVDPPAPAAQSPEAASPGAPLSPEAEAMVERLRNVQFGTLFQLKPDGEDRAQRLRLSWYNPTTARYMFVDQDGVTAAVKDVATLAHELANGQARLLTLPAKPFVERALTAIRDTIARRLGGASTTRAEEEHA